MRGASKRGFSERRQEGVGRREIAAGDGDVHTVDDLLELAPIHEDPARLRDLELKLDVALQLVFLFRQNTGDGIGWARTPCTVSRVDTSSTFGSAPVGGRWCMNST